MSGCHNPYILEYNNFEKRLSKLESSKLSQELDPKVWAYVHERINKIESNVSHLDINVAMLNLKASKNEDNNLTERIENIEKQLRSLEDHKNRQIDENRKISHKVEGLEISISVNKSDVSYAHRKIDEMENSNKKPHKCPVCEGCGNDKGTQVQNPNYQFCMKYASCNTCEGKGIVWG